LGGFLCIVYDVLRVMRMKFCCRKGVTLFISDFLFCIFATVCMLVLFFNLTYGKVRVYAFVFALMGFLLWRVTFGRLITALLLKLLNLFSAIYNLAKKRVFAIVLQIMRSIYTKNCCRRLVKNASCGFGLIKRKDVKSERIDKQTDAS